MTLWWVDKIVVMLLKMFYKLLPNQGRSTIFCKVTQLITTGEKNKQTWSPQSQT